MATPKPFSPLYCTWSHRPLLAPSLKNEFRDLDQFLRVLVSSARSKLIIVSPYLSPAGMMSLKGSIAVSAQRGAWIRLVTTDLDEVNGWNRRALNTLTKGEDGLVIKERLRILSAATEETMLFHAKIIIADGQIGYLGSANLSFSAMETNFEVGTSLLPSQAKAIEDLIGFWESQEILIDSTQKVFPE